MRKALQSYSRVIPCEVKRLFDDGVTLAAMHTWYAVNVGAKLVEVDASKRARYTTAEKTAIHSTFYAAVEVMVLERVIYGYWYEEKFYTNAQNRGTAEKLIDLHQKLGSKMAEWDKLTHGMYHRDSLKLYFPGRKQGE